MGLFSKPGRGFAPFVLKTGAPLKCLVCGTERFSQRPIKLPSPAAAFFDLEWVSPTALGLSCERCGYVHVFRQDA